MKKFLQTLAIVAGAVVLVSVLVFSAKFALIRKRCDFTLPAGRHILIVGNSMGETAFNDTILPGVVNRCRSSHFFYLMRPMIERSIEANPGLDTVYIVAGIPSFFSFNDQRHDKRHTVGEFGSKSLHIALSSAEEYKVMMRANQFIPFFLSNAASPIDLNLSGNIPDKYLYLYRHKLRNGSGAGPGYLALEDTLRQRGSRTYSFEEIRKRSSIQYEGLKTLITTCRRHGVEPVLINTPLYRIGRYFDDSGYKQALSSLDDGRLLIADYADFAFPDTSCYGDVYHINHEGATYFSRHLRDNGVKLQRVSDYVKTGSGDKSANRDKLPCNL